MTTDGVRLMTQDKEGTTRGAKSFSSRGGVIWDTGAAREGFLLKLMKLKPQGSSLAWAPSRPTFHL